MTPTGFVDIRVQRGHLADSIGIIMQQGFTGVSVAVSGCSVHRRNLILAQAGPVIISQSAIVQ